MFYDDDNYDEDDLQEGWSPAGSDPPIFKDIRTLDGLSHGSNIRKCIWKDELSL